MAGNELIAAVALLSLAGVAVVLALVLRDMAIRKPFHLIETKMGNPGVVMVRRLQGENESLRARLAEHGIKEEDESEVPKEDPASDDTVQLERI